MGALIAVWQVSQKNSTSSLAFFLAAATVLWALFACNSAAENLGYDLSRIKVLFYLGAEEQDSQRSTFVMGIWDTKLLKDAVT